MRHATFRTASHLLLGALLFSAAGISTAEAGQRRGPPPAPMGPPPGQGEGRGQGEMNPREGLRLLKEHAKELGLSEATLNQIKELARKGRDSRGALDDRLDDARDKMRDLMQSDSPDRAKVMAAIDEAGRAEIALRQHDVEVLLQIRALLTPAQREAMKKLMQEERGGRRCGEGRGDGPGRGEGRRGGDGRNGEGPRGEDDN
jgi:Spy/CpxP family protein refolding chaperone